ncbi:hypothetical protein [Streptomyces sp. NPDC087300]|uniref:hypothetical protein n=1 Tax=Streptomyces sp. NPDC087300 TaxID=3365780 RepID=UPI0038242556
MLIMRWRRADSTSKPDSFHQRCAAQVQSLGLPVTDQLTINEVCERLSQRSGRPIRLVPFALPFGSPDGLWVSAEDEDFVVFEQRLAPIHQQQVILHEFGHVLCQHEAAPIMSPEASQLLLPSLDPEMIRRTLGREHSRTEAEKEAEYVGSLIGRRISSWATQPFTAVPPEARELVARLAALEAPTSRMRHE